MTFDMTSVNPEDITGKAGTTVQVLGMDPHSLTKFLQVHNILETVQLGAPIIAMYGARAKPPGFGNAGGGIEPDELVHFQKNEPEWFEHYSSLGTLTPTELAIIGCALRESKDESGFCDLEIVLDEDSEKLIILTDFHYRDIDPEKGVSNVKGHRVVTVWGKYNSYQQRPIKEKDEVDYIAWIDFGMPMTEIFKRLRQELGESAVYPYWSHIRRSLIGFSKIDNYHKNREERPYLIGRMIHPSWRLVFRVGNGDSRFPLYGYQISPRDWYAMFDIMLGRGIEYLDNDMLLSSMFPGIREKIVSAKKQQEQRMEREKGAAQVATETIPDPSDLAGSEDYTGLRSSAEILQAEDEAYCKWMESELGIRS